MADYYDNSIPSQRFQPGTTVRSDEVDAKFDQVATAFDEVADDVLRSLKLPVGTVIDQTIIQNALQRRNATLGFDADGNLTILAGLRWAGDWKPGTDYVVGSMVAAPNLNLYISDEQHTSGSSFNDTKWSLAVDVDAVNQARIAAESARDDSQTAKGQSETARQESRSARDKAQKWSEHPEDVEVESGAYSALHHSAKSQTAQQGSESARDLSKQYRNQSQAAMGDSQSAQSASESARDLSKQYRNESRTARNDSQSARQDSRSARDKAQEWSESPEDVAVELGKYSARHHSAKADAARQGAESQKGLAVTARQESESARDLSRQYRNASQAAKGDSEAALADFLTRYLGPHSTEPTQDGSGNALQEGALYLRTASTNPGMHYWDGAAWQMAYGTLDVGNYATATQGGKADTAYGWGDHSAAGYLTTETTYSAGTGIDLTGTTFSLSDERFTTAQKNKLSGIAQDATKNSSDAHLLNRSNHTGTQTLSTISDAGTAASRDTGTGAGNVILGNDSRLTDSRTPTSHNHDNRYYTKTEITNSVSTNRYDVKSATATSTLNLNAQQIFRVSATSNRNLTFSNAPGSNRSMTVFITFTGNTGIINWPSGLKWGARVNLHSGQLDSSAPDLMGSWTSVVLIWEGAKWRGFFSGGED